MLSRRSFIELLAKGSAGAILYSTVGLGVSSRFNLCQLAYSGNWNPRPNFSSRLLASLEMRTSVVVSDKAKTLRALDSELFNYPFLYLAGDGDFAPFSSAERARLRKYLKLGGTLLIDDASGQSHSEFDKSIRREMGEILPEPMLQRIPPDHAVYRSFYLLYSAAGRKIVEPYLEGVTFSDEERTPVIYCRNDLGGALEEDAFGRWKHTCIPGGESQRELAIRLAVNIVVYALTGSYKTDKVHEPFIKRRQQAL